MSKKKRKKYIPSTKFNPVILSKKIEENKALIEQNRVVNEHKYRALEDFVGLLINFASHDIKNAVHTMDGMISTINVENLTQGDIDGLKLSMDNIREILENFAKFNLEKREGRFSLFQLFNCLEILHRPKLRSSHIKYEVRYSGVNKEQIIEHDFHPFLQMFNNLMINSITALENSEEKSIRLEVSMFEENVVVAFMDTGCGIEAEDKPKVFTQYYSTKPNGTGVGLTHAKYVVNNYKGSIEISETDQPGFSTTFVIVFPLK